MPTNLRERLDCARLHLCTDARQSQGDLAAFLDAVLGAGVDIVQLRTAVTPRPAGAAGGPRGPQPAAPGRHAQRAAP